MGLDGLSVNGKQVTALGNVPVFMTYESAVMRGLIEGASGFSSNGHYVAAGPVAAHAPVHCTGAVNVAPVAGVQMAFVSTSAQDGPAGTGIRTIAVGYIEAVTFRAVTEIITLNGLTPVNSVATNIRFINTITMLSSGTAVTGAAAGTITATNGGLTYGGIVAGERAQESAYRMVPAGKRFIPHEIFASANSGAAASQVVFHTVGWSDALPYFIPTNAIGTQDGPIPLNLRAGRALAAGSIIGVEFASSKAVEVTASIIGHLENA